MSYNMQEFPKYLHTAGKITVLTSLIGVVVFAFVFLLNLGAQELQQVEAQGIATTSITVLKQTLKCVSQKYTSTHGK